MSLTYTCACGSSFTVTEQRAGSERRCHVCGRQFRFPGLPESAASKGPPADGRSPVEKIPTEKERASPEPSAEPRPAGADAGTFGPSTWYGGLHVSGRLVVAALLLVVPIAFWSGLESPLPGFVAFGLVALLVVLVVGRFESLTLDTGVDGRPVLVCRRYLCFCACGEAVYDLADYRSLGLNNTEPRERADKIGFLFVGGLVAFFPVKSGTRAGKWQLSLRGPEEGEEITVFGDHSLGKLKQITAAITRASGLRVGR
jgi:hypothetical protein